jgi:membrane-bound lytic murein transglycosylase
MRRPATIAARIATAVTAIAAIAALGAGCSAKPVKPPATPAGAAASTPGSAAAQACGNTRKVINDATAKFTAQLSAAVAAGEKGDTNSQRAAMAALRATFKEWSVELRSQADTSTDPQFKATLVEYAGAVEATISRVHTPQDLDILATFDDRELDVAANKLADVCH